MFLIKIIAIRKLQRSFFHFNTWLYTVQYLHTKVMISKIKQLILVNIYIKSTYSFNPASKNYHLFSLLQNFLNSKIFENTDQKIKYI